MEFDGNLPRMALPFWGGDRFSLVVFTSSQWGQAPASTRRELRKAGFVLPPKSWSKGSTRRIGQQWMEEDTDESEFDWGFDRGEVWDPAEWDPDSAWLAWDPPPPAPGPEAAEEVRRAVDVFLDPSLNVGGGVGGLSDDWGPEPVSFEDALDEDGVPELSRRVGGRTGAPGARGAAMALGEAPGPYD